MKHELVVAEKFFKKCGGGFQYLQELYKALRLDAEIFKNEHLNNKFRIVLHHSQPRGKLMRAWLWQLKPPPQLLYLLDHLLELMHTS